MTPLSSRVRSILDQLVELGDAECAASATRALERLDEPLRVAIAGRVKAGKSTLLNALIGEAVAATDAAECTRVVTWYQRSNHYDAAAVMTDGGRTPVVLDRSSRTASIDLSGVDERAIDRLEVGVPSPRLAQLVLIDTPGIDSISENVSDRATDFLAPQPGDQGADVLVFLMRYLHSEDSQFLEAFTDPAARAVDPVRSVAVLSRADELGSGRGDGLIVAAEVAERYRHHHHLRQVISEVFPVSGLLAFFAATLTQREYDLLSELADLDGEDLDRLTTSVSRFRAESSRLSSSTNERAEILNRMGLPGVRLAVTAIRTGVVSTPGGLAMLLGELSGIDPLRRMLLERFASRATALKAARALDLAEGLAAMISGREGRALQREVERARLNAHELRELHAIRALIEHTERDVVGIAPDALLRHLGHQGGGAASRLNVDSGESATAMTATAAALITRLYDAANGGYASRTSKEVLLTAATSLEIVHHQLQAADVELGSDEAFSQREGNGV